MHLKDLSRWLYVEDWCNYFLLESAWKGQIEADDWKWNLSLLLLWYVRLFSFREHTHCVWKPVVNERAHTLSSNPRHDTPPTTDALEPQSSIWYRAELSSSPARVSLLSPYLSIHAQEVCVYQAFLSMAIGVITRDGRYFLCSHN